MSTQRIISQPLGPNNVTAIFIFDVIFTIIWNMNYCNNSTICPRMYRGVSIP